MGWKGAWGRRGERTRCGGHDELMGGRGRVRELAEGRWRRAWATSDLRSVGLGSEETRHCPYSRRGQEVKPNRTGRKRGKICEERAKVQSVKSERTTGLGEMVRENRVQVRYKVTMS